MSAMAGLDGIEGFLSLSYFRSAPVTVDHPAGIIVLEDAQSLARRAESGVIANLRVNQDGYATDVFLGLDLPGGRSISAEVDSGSDALILDTALAGGLGVDLADRGVRKVDGSDEVGKPFTRYFTTLHGDISVTGCPAIRQHDPEAIFQKIIYDGLVGHAFLKDFIVTYDLPGARMVFAQPGA